MSPAVLLAALVGSWNCRVDDLTPGRNAVLVFRADRRGVERRNRRAEPFGFALYDDVLVWHPRHPGMGQYRYRVHFRGGAARLDLSPYGYWDRETGWTRYPGESRYACRRAR